MADCNKTAVFLREKDRMCLEGCDRCKLSSSNNGTNNICDLFIKLYPDETIAIVQQWSNQNPRETRQSKFLKQYPDAHIIDGVLDICPFKVDTGADCNVNRVDPCLKCRREYWLEEVE